MANLSLKLFTDTSDFKKGLNGAKKSLQGFEGSTKKISRGIGKALGALGVAAGIGALVSGLKQATLAAAEDAKSQKLLAGQLKRTLGATEAQIKANEDFIKSLSLASGIADDNLRPALANAVRGTGSLEEGQKLLSIALDGAAASGKPLNTVLNALIRANNGNETALYRLAPELKKVKGGIDDYARSVKGAAETAADPFARFNVAVGEIQESIGTLLLPLVQDLAKYFVEDLAPAIQDFFDKINDPNSNEGVIFNRIKGIAEDIFNIFKNLGKDQSFQKRLNQVLSIAETLLDVLTAISEIDLDGSKGELGTGALNSDRDTLSRLGLTPEKIKADAAKRGIKLTLSEANRAMSDFTGGADGNPATPWPMAKGGIVMPRVGGTLARIGEAGKPEAVIPLDRFGGLGSNTYIININKAAVTGNEIVAAIQRYERGTGRKLLLNG
jgi:hypothetical protein